MNKRDNEGEVFSSILIFTIFVQIHVVYRLIILELIYIFFKHGVIQNDFVYLFGKCLKKLD